MKHALPDMGLQLTEQATQEAKPEMATPKQLAAFVGMNNDWAEVVKEQVPWQ